MSSCTNHDRAAVAARAIVQIFDTAPEVCRRQVLKDYLRDEFEDERRQAYAEARAAIDREPPIEAEMIPDAAVTTELDMITEPEVMIKRDAMTDPEVMTDGEPNIDA